MTDPAAYIHEEINAAIVLRREQLLENTPEPSADLADLVVEALEWTGQPQHITQIRQFVGHRYDFGANPSAEVCSACRRDPRVERTAKGTYGLATWRTNTFGDGTVADKVVALLRATKHEMHYMDIYLRLSRERGVEAGGQNPGNSLLPRFSRDPRIRQLGHGMYGLVEWYSKV